MSSPRRPPGIAMSGPFVMAALLCASLAGCREREAADKRPEVVATLTAKAEPAGREVRLAGTVDARIRGDVSFRVAGRIERRLAEVGDHVRAGDVLATLETEEQRADVEAAAATLRSAEATLTQARAGFDRQERLLATGSTTRSAFDEAKRGFRTADSALDTARADLANAEESLSFTVLKADADGTITARNAEAGQVVDVAQAIFTLAHDGDRDVVLDVPEQALAKGWARRTIDVALVSDPHVRTTAVVRETSPAVDRETGSIRVKASLDDAPPAFSLGAAVTGSATLASESLVRLPWRALTTLDARPAVWVVAAADRSVAPRPVAIARYRTHDVLLSGGVRDGEEVVVGGAQFLRPGEVVEAREDGAR